MPLVLFDIAWLCHCLAPVVISAVVPLSVSNYLGRGRYTMVGTASMRSTAEAAGFERLAVAALPRLRAVCVVACHDAAVHWPPKDGRPTCCWCVALWRSAVVR